MSEIEKRRMDIVITGGAGGISRALLALLSERITGRVGLIDIDGEGLREVAGRYSTHALKIETYCLDLREDEAVRYAIADFTHVTGSLDILFANAGVMTADVPFEQAGGEAIHRSIDLNFRCVANTTAAAWAALAAKGGHVIVNASQAGLHPLPSDVVYSASKAAAVMFGKANAARADQTGIRFNIVCPGVVDTPILNDQSGTKRRDEVGVFEQHFELLDPREIAEEVFGLMIDSEANGRVLEISNRRRIA